MGPRRGPLSAKLVHAVGHLVANLHALRRQRARHLSGTATHRSDNQYLFLLVHLALQENKTKTSRRAPRIVKITTPGYPESSTPLALQNRDAKREKAKRPRGTCPEKTTHTRSAYLCVPSRAVIVYKSCPGTWQGRDARPTVTLYREENRLFQR